MRVTTFVDDFLQMLIPILTTDHKDMLIHMLTDLGLTLNYEKSVLTPNNEVTFVGFRVHSTGNNGPWIAVLPQKIKKLRRLICSALDKQIVKA